MMFPSEVLNDLFQCLNFHVYCYFRLNYPMNLTKPMHHLPMLKNTYAYIYIHPTQSVKIHWLMFTMYKDNKMHPTFSNTSLVIHWTNQLSSKLFPHAVIRVDFISQYQLSGFMSWWLPIPLWENKQTKVSIYSACLTVPSLYNYLTGDSASLYFLTLFLLWGH